MNPLDSGIYDSDKDDSNFDETVFMHGKGCIYLSIYLSLRRLLSYLECG